MTTPEKLVIAYAAIAFISLFVYKKRAGMGVFTSPSITPTIIGFFLWSLIKAVLWPLILIVWIVTGRPQPRMKLEQY